MITSHKLISLLLILFLGASLDLKGQEETPREFFFPEMASSEDVSYYVRTNNDRGEIGAGSYHYNGELLKIYYKPITKYYGNGYYSAFESIDKATGNNEIILWHQIIESGNRIISDNRKLYIFSKAGDLYTFSDPITLLVLPKEGYVSKWEETIEGVTWCCEASLVWAEDDNHEFYRCIKTTKQSPNQTEICYWVKGYGLVLKRIEDSNTVTKDRIGRFNFRKTYSEQEYVEECYSRFVSDVKQHPKDIGIDNSQFAHSLSEILERKAADEYVLSNKSVRYSVVISKTPEWNNVYVTSDLGKSTSVIEESVKALSGFADLCFEEATDPISGEKALYDLVYKSNFKPTLWKAIDLTLTVKKGKVKLSGKAAKEYNRFIPAIETAIGFDSSLNEKYPVRLYTFAIGQNEYCYIDIDGQGAVFVARERL